MFPYFFELLFYITECFSFCSYGKRKVYGLWWFSASSNWMCDGCDKIEQLRSAAGTGQCQHLKRMKDREDVSRDFSTTTCSLATLRSCEGSTVGYFRTKLCVLLFVTSDQSWVRICVLETPPFPSVTASLDCGPSLLNHRPVLVWRLDVIEGKG